MIFKHKETGDLYVTDNTNLFSMLEREGYRPETVEKTEENTEESTERAALIAKAKELGIKSPHMMKLETLKEKIAEIEK